MVGQLNGTFWCPRSHELTVRLCADPPSKKDLAQILYKLMLDFSNMPEEMLPAFHRTADLVLKHPPSPCWSLMLISTMDVNNRIFAKDYVKPKPQPKTSLFQQAVVPAFNGFFDNLPVIEKKKGAGRVSFLTKE